MEHIVVIGAGQAGASLVARLRAKGFGGAITLIGAESAPPYQRPPLSKAYLLGEMAAERLYLRPADFYANQNITLRLNTTVEGIDIESRQIALTDGTVIGYDALVLTTGSVPLRLPEAIGGTLSGVFTLRDLSDVDALRPWMREGAKAVIVGGGYIGLEGAAVARKLGLEVTLVEMAPRILSRVAAPETSDYFRALHQSHGVEILESTALARLEGDAEGRVRRAILADGRSLEADVVITGLGIRPASDLAQAAGLRLENGIAVDSYGQTSDPHIWAAGDCTSFPWLDDRARGEPLRLESVPNAIEQAELVADNLLGATQVYRAKPWFWSDQYDVKLQIAGLNRGYDRVVIRQDGAARSHWYFAGERLLAVDAMNDPRGFMVAKRLIEAGRSPEPEAVADPATDLKALLNA